MDNSKLIKAILKIDKETNVLEKSPVMSHIFLELQTGGMTEENFIGTIAALSLKVAKLERQRSKT